MVRDVINGITEAMAAEFPEKDGYVIYYGDVPQEFTPGAFLVYSIMLERDKKSFAAYEYDELVAIQYNPRNGQEEIDDVVTRLQECLEIINVTHGEDYTKPTRTEQRDMAVVDGVLTYTLRVADVYFRIPQGDDMTDVEIGVTHGE